MTTSTPGAPSGAVSYPIQQSYNDAGSPTSMVYPDGETVTTSYTAQGAFAGLTTTLSGTTTTLVGNVTYSSTGGAVGAIAGAQIGNNTYQYASTYDPLGRATDTRLTRTSDSAVLFDQSRGYDAVSNAVSVQTTLPTGTDNQAFCYDALNRLTWASSQSGTVPCGGTLAAGSLGGSASYTNCYAYDTLDRLTSGPLGSYTYGNAQHLDAATAIGSGYTAAYDAAGNMTCRAPTSGATCAGTQTGAQLTFDNEGRLSAWQNAPGGSPSSNTLDLYDGSGNRVEQFIANGATTTTVTYVSNIEEVSTTAGITSTTTSYYEAGKRVAQAVNGVFSYLGSDGLGSAEVALDSSGNAQAAALFDPYGSVRYTSGTMPGSYGFTGQHADAATGLDYYNARYYDAVAGQFASADTVQDGLNRYAYVHGNPTTATDPTGQMQACDCGGSPPPPPPCSSPSCVTPQPAPVPSKPTPLAVHLQLPDCAASGVAKCVLFIAGVDVQSFKNQFLKDIPPFAVFNFGYEEGGQYWTAWTNYLVEDGFGYRNAARFYAAWSGPDGDMWIRDQVKKLKHIGFAGHITLVGRNWSGELRSEGLTGEDGLQGR